MLLPVSEAQHPNLRVCKEGQNNPLPVTAERQYFRGCPCSKKNKLEAVGPDWWEFMPENAGSDFEKLLFIIAYLSNKRIASIRKR